MRGRWLTGLMHYSEHVSSTRCPPRDELSLSRVRLLAGFPARDVCIERRAQQCSFIDPTRSGTGWPGACAPEEPYGIRLNRRRLPCRLKGSRTCSW